MTVEAKRNLSIEEIDKENYLHPYTQINELLEQGPHVFVGANGIYVTDNKGREYIDAFSGMGCCNIGFGRKEVIDAIAEQSRKLAWYHTLDRRGTEPTALLAQKLLEIAPPNMARAYLISSGSEANDAQVRIVWLYNSMRGKPNKRKIISVKQGYHGTTVATASLTGVDCVHDGFGLPLPGFLKTTCPHHYWNAEPGMSEDEFARHLARQLDALIEKEGPDTVAAFIQEPVLGGGGAIVPPRGYYAEISKVLKKHDVLFIDDEVVCGFGRLGQWLGCQAFEGFEPDLISVAKGITSAYFPVSGVLISHKVWEVLVEGSKKQVMFGIGGTYNGHPTGAAAALANIAVMERENMIENARTVGAYLGQRLHEEYDDHPLVGEVRGLGLLHGIELVADKKSKKSFDWGLNIAAQCEALCKPHNLMMHISWPNTPSCNTLLFAPALPITREEVDEMLRRFSRGLGDLQDKLVRDGVWKG